MQVSELGSPGLLLVIAAVLGIVGYVASRPIRRPAKGRPLPGPPGLPIIGNLLQIPSKHSWLLFKEWADTYGPIFRFSIGSQTYVLISKEKIVNDLLRERGALYSSRAQPPFAAQLLSDNLRPLLMPYDDVWRRVRKLMHRLTMPKMATSYQPLQSLEAKKLLYDLLRDPSGYERHFERYSSGLIFRLVYGRTVENGGEPDVRKVVEVNHTLERVASPGAYLVDSIPALMMLPEWIAPFKKEGKQLHQKEITLFRSLLKDVKERMESGSCPGCFAKMFWEEEEDIGLTVDQGAYALGTLFETGTGTTSALMMSFCLCMCLHPDWQEKGAQEIQSVCGENMPEFSDIPQLPTVRAIIKEVSRWRPVTAGGIPHLLIEDDVYDGYHLPVGSLVCPNQWAIHGDAEQYPDGDVFNPDRWLNPKYPTYQAPLTVYPNLTNYSMFGFGRRICPGMNIAERSAHLLTARLLWGCILRKKRDANGVEIDIPTYSYTSGFNTQPEPFQFEILPRNWERGKAVESAYLEAKKTDPLAG